MNTVYGLLAIAISLVVSRVFARPHWPAARIILIACLVEFVSISALGGVFFLFGLGFFGDPIPVGDKLIRIFGLSAFLGVLVGMHSMNRARMMRAAPAEQ